MRIISIKKGFSSDHSSTSYEFLAVDKPLGKKEKGEVASLSSRAIPTSRNVSFSYHVDGYDIPGGWERLMEKYYDVMYCQDYDWYTLAMAFNGTKEQMEDLYKYEFSGMDEMGISINTTGSRITIVIHCRVNIQYLDDYYDEYEDYFEEEDYFDEDDEDFEEEELDDEGSINYAANDGLLDLLVKVRQQIANGDYRTLYEVWQKYGYDVEEEDEIDIPIPENRKDGKDIVDEFASILGDV